MLAAAAGAASLDATMFAVTVVRPLPGVYGALDMTPITGGAVAFERSALKQAGIQLVALASEQGIPADNCRIKLGAPAREIRALAEELKVDLIVIGTHARHGLGLLLGSTANGVLHGVGCDVLAVKIHNQTVT